MRRSFTLLLLALVLGSVPAFSASRSLDRSWSFPAQGGKRIVVDTSDMDVQLRVGDVREILVTVDAHISNVTERQAEAWATMHTPEISDTDGSLKIETKRGPKGILGHLTARARLFIVAPMSAIPDLATLSGNITVTGDFPDAAPLRLATMTGDVSFLGAARSLTAIATSGKVELQVVRPLEELIVRTTSGRVTFTGGARKVNVDTASGAISLKNLSGSAEISTSSGAITLTWDRLDADQGIVVRSTRGNIHLSVPPGVKPAGELRTVKGKIEARIPGTRSDDGTTLQLPGEGPVFDVETAKGQIVLTVWGPGENPAAPVPSPGPTPPF